MRTNEQIFSDIRETGFIIESDMQLLKNRSNKAGKDLFDYSIIDSIEVRITEEQGAKGLQWLKKFTKKGLYGYRELDILGRATSEDFMFKGFYNVGTFQVPYFLPIYDLCGMEYVPKNEPYIIG
jgi:hypothetical protein